MHPETKKDPRKHVLFTLTEKSKATTRPWFSCLLWHPARNGMFLFWDTTHVYWHVGFNFGTVC